MMEIPQMRTLNRDDLEQKKEYQLEKQNKLQNYTFFNKKNYKKMNLKKHKTLWKC